MFYALLLTADFSKINFFENSFKNTIVVSNRLGLNQARPDLGPICLQGL